MEYGTIAKNPHIKLGWHGFVRTGDDDELRNLPVYKKYMNSILYGAVSCDAFTVLRGDEVAIDRLYLFAQDTDLDFNSNPLYFDLIKESDARVKITDYSLNKTQFLVTVGDENAFLIKTQPKLAYERLVLDANAGFRDLVYFNSHWFFLQPQAAYGQRVYYSTKPPAPTPQGSQPIVFEQFSMPLGTSRIKRLATTAGYLFVFTTDYIFVYSSHSSLGGAAPITNIPTATRHFYLPDDDDDVLEVYGNVIYSLGSDKPAGKLQPYVHSVMKSELVQPSPAIFLEEKITVQPYDLQMYRTHPVVFSASYYGKTYIGFSVNRRFPYALYDPVQQTFIWATSLNETDQTGIFPMARSNFVTWEQNLKGSYRYPFKHKDKWYVFDEAYRGIKHYGDEFIESYQTGAVTYKISAKSKISSISVSYVAEKPVRVVISNAEDYGGTVSSDNLWLSGNGKFEYKFNAGGRRNCYIRFLFSTDGSLVLKNWSLNYGT